jgi:hypothetical protein
MIHERVETGWGVNIHLGHGPVEEVLERSACLVFRIEVEQSAWNLIGFEPLSQRNHQAGLANSAFATHSEDDSFVLLFDLHRDSS